MANLVKLSIGVKVVLASAWVAGLGLAAQSAVPDAQVESNVLRALASAPELAAEAITTQTVYGVVTLSGTVRDEGRRRQAETLAASSAGVKKVVDELRLMDSEVNASLSAAGQAPAPLVLQSDGTYAPATPSVDSTPAPLNTDQPAAGSAPAATAQRNDPDADQALDRQMAQPPAPQSPAPITQSQQPTQPATAQVPQQPSYPAGGRRPMYAPGYPSYPAYPGPYAGAPYRGPAAPAAGGQAGGQSVVIPSGTMVRVRLNRALSSDRTPAGTTFDGIVANDVVAGNEVAIPRGAAVQGTVVTATRSGALKGRGELTIQLTQVTLGGKSYALVSDTWGTHGRDKTIETVNKTAGFGAVGAVIGALAGGGAGAAIGGGVGAAAGLGSSAASGDGQSYLPAEALVTFHTAQPVTLTTVSEQEMQRLAYGVPAGADREGQYRRAYPRVYLGPGYYRGYYPYPPAYGPYGYPAY